MIYLVHNAALLLEYDIAEALQKLVSTTSRDRWLA